MLKHISLISGAILLAGMTMIGCKTTNPVPAVSETRELTHNPIAHLSDLIALTNNLPGTRRVAYFAVEMNDQVNQPFDQSGSRKTFPLWTDIDLKCCYSNANGQIGEIIFSTVMGSEGTESPILENTPYVSVEIPAVYVNTPDARINARMDYTKYSSIANFLYANGMEGMTFESLESANSRYAGIKRQDPEYGYWWNVFRYAPKVILVKIDFGMAGTQMIHNENRTVSFSYNRRIGCMNRETAKVDEDYKTVWTPIFPRWVRTSYFNEFARGDVQ